MDKVEFPARLVGYRLDVPHEHIVLFDDKPVLWSNAELEQRLDMYRGLAASSGNAHTFEVVSLEDLEAMMATTRSELESQLDHMLDRQADPWDEAVDKAAELAGASRKLCTSGNRAVSTADSSVSARDAVLRCEVAHWPAAVRV